MDGALEPVEQPAALDLAGELEAAESYALAGLTGEAACLRERLAGVRGLVRATRA